MGGKWSKEDLAEIKKIPIVDYAQNVLNRTPVRIGSYYTFKDMDSIRIDPRKNTFHRYSDDAHGDVIEFVEYMENCGFKEAVEKLTPHTITPLPHASPEEETYQTKPKQSKKKLFVPPKFENPLRVFDYLVKERCISSSIVSSLITDGYLYEDHYHQCVFVGRKNGVSSGPVSYLISRKTVKDHNGSYREFPGNDYSQAVYLNYGSKRLIVSESAISGLSVATLLEKLHRPLKQNNYLFLGGAAKLNALVNHAIRDQPEEIVLALDNDNAGRLAAKKATDLLKENGYKGKIIEFLPAKEGRDWNDEVVNFEKTKEKIKIISQNKRKEKEAVLER